MCIRKYCLIVFLIVFMCFVNLSCCLNMMSDISIRSLFVMLLLVIDVSELVLDKSLRFFILILFKFLLFFMICFIGCMRKLIMF